MDRLSRRIIKASVSEFDLTNTLLNGQCFNWTKLAPQKVKGVFKNYLVVLERTSDEEIEMVATPTMPQEVFENQFLDSYL